MRDVLEIETRWPDADGDTLLDITHVDARGGFWLADRELVRDGAVTASEHGRVGLVDYTIRRVSRAPRTLPRPEIRDGRAGTYLVISLAVHLVVWGVAVERHPPEPRPAWTHATKWPTRVGLHTSAPASKTPPIRDDDDSPDDTEHGRGAPMALSEGTAGDARSKRERGHIQIAERAADPALPRAQAIEQAQRAGILSSLDSIAPQGIAALVGTADSASGFDPRDITGPLHGGDGEARGNFGTGYRGAGLGGGCATPPCNGLIGVDRYGTLSNGTTAGDGWGGRGGGAGTLERRRARVPGGPTVILCGRQSRCVISGDLDKAIIRRYIKRHMTAITYCYEKELIAKPTLHGTVTAEFLIAADGHVASSTASGGDAEVGACIAGVISRIEFPRSATGTSTQVRYPFLIRLAGS
ncbi:MAG: AgmX/PglI C-terminal domain-containing protein [Deltaproteobacteria bacterium]|nr:AgmX/PglI C-terminal domain-containing protein [Deltaproteobacteria bacterium]